MQKSDGELHQAFRMMCHEIATAQGRSAGDIAKLQLGAALAVFIEACGADQVSEWLCREADAFKQQVECYPEMFQPGGRA